MGWLDLAEFAFGNAAGDDRLKKGKTFINYLPAIEFGETRKVARFRNDDFRQHDPVARTDECSDGLQNESQKVGRRTFEVLNICRDRCDGCPDGMLHQAAKNGVLGFEIKIDRTLRDAG